MNISYVNSVEDSNHNYISLCRLHSPLEEAKSMGVCVSFLCQEFCGWGWVEIK